MDLLRLRPGSLQVSFPLSFRSDCSLVVHLIEGQEVTGRGGRGGGGGAGGCDVSSAPVHLHCCKTGPYLILQPYLNLSC